MNSCKSNKFYECKKNFADDWYLHGWGFDFYDGKIQNQFTNKFKKSVRVIEYGNEDTAILETNNEEYMLETIIFLVDKSGLNYKKSVGTFTFFNPKDWLISFFFYLIFIVVYGII